MTSYETHRPRPRRRVPRRQGYSLVELVIAFAAAIIILLVLFQAFQAKTQLARTQIDVSDMQQAQRVIQHEMSRLIRMTGRGGLADMVDRGNGTRYQPALTVRDDVASGQNIAIGDASTPLVAEGTDVLTIRGVFNSPVYQLNFASPATLALTSMASTPPTTRRPQTGLSSSPIRVPLVCRRI